MCQATDAYCELTTNAACSWLVYDLCTGCATTYGRAAKVTCHFNDASGRMQILAFDAHIIPGHESDDLPEICIRLLNEKHWRDFKMTAIQFMYEKLDNENISITTLFPTAIQSN